MAIRVYGIKNCDSVKKALQFFQTHNIAYEFIDFKTVPLTQERLDRWIADAGIKKLFNTRSATYRKHRLKEIAQTDQEKIQWMLQEPLLIKRPVVELPEGDILVGFDQTAYTRSLL